MSEPRDEQLEQYFESMKQLWDFGPFQVWLKELGDMVSNINSVEQTKGNDDLFFRSGQMNVIRLNMNLRDNIELLEADYLRSLESDDDDEPNPDGLYQS